MCVVAFVTFHAATSSRVGSERVANRTTVFCAVARSSTHVDPTWKIHVATRSGVFILFISEFHLLRDISLPYPASHRREEDYRFVGSDVSIGANSSGEFRMTTGRCLASAASAWDFATLTQIVVLGGGPGGPGRRLPGYPEPDSCERSLRKIRGGRFLRRLRSARNGIPASQSTSRVFPRSWRGFSRYV